MYLITMISSNRYYPIFLIISSLLLATTFSFYSFRRRLLDHLTRIMRHFAGNMLVAFLVLSINQVFEVKKSSEAGCYLIGIFIKNLKKRYSILVKFSNTNLNLGLAIFCILGVLQSFFFLSAFMFMTIMSYETFRRIR